MSTKLSRLETSHPWAGMPPGAAVADWTADEVAGWLQRVCGVPGEVTAEFLRNQVDGELLLALDERSFAELGLTSALAVAKVRVRLGRLVRESPVKVGLIARVPIVNIIYRLLFDEEPPHLDSVKSTLDTIALLAALFLTIAMALPTGVAFDELEAARARFSAPPYDSMFSGDQIVRDFGNAIAVATFMLGSALIATVCAIVSILVTQAEIEGRPEATRRFWRFARWGAVWAIGSLIAGVIGCFLAFNRLVFIKLPDVMLERGGGWPSMIFAYVVAANVVLLGSLVGVFMLMGLGHASAAASIVEDLERKVTA